MKKTAYTSRISHLINNMNGLYNNEERRVIDAMFDADRPMCREEIRRTVERYYFFPINHASRTIANLKEKNAIDVADQRKSPYTGRLVEFYKLNTTKLFSN
jgi:hypothetical protein